MPNVKIVKPRTIRQVASENVQESQEVWDLLEDALSGEITREQFWKIVDELIDAEVVAISQRYVVVEACA